MSDYAHVAGGSLKFKGGDSAKKKKKKSHSSSDRKDIESSIAESSRTQEKERVEGDDRDKRRRDEDRDRRERSGERDEVGRSRKIRLDEEEEGDEELPPKKSGGRQMTDSERKFEEIQRQRRMERVSKTAKMSHKDRVSEFNSKLDKLTEHNDIPKISWTG